MLEQFQIPDFGVAGLNADFPPWGLPPGVLTNLQNARIESGKLCPFGGNKEWVTLPVDFQPGYVQYVESPTSKFWVICGLDAVYAYDGSTLSNITSTAGYAGLTDEDLWNGCSIANIPVFNNAGHVPEYWSPQNGATLLQPLPWDSSNTWAAVSESAKIIRSHKQFLFALNLESATYGEVPDGVRWSAPADVGSVPPTWDETDTTDVAGLTTLGGGGGSIVDGLSLRNAFCVYRESGITIFDFVGGQFVWRIRNLSSQEGLLSKDSVVEVEGVHYFITDGDILSNDGNRIRSIAHNRIKKKIVSNFNPDAYDKCYAFRNNASNEIWFCTPSSGSDYPDIAYIWNWRDDYWSIRDIPASPSGNSGLLTTPQLNWDTITDTWGSSSNSWDQRQGTPLDDAIVIAVKPTGAGLSGSLELPNIQPGESEVTFDTIVEKVGMPIEGAIGVTTISRIYPKFSGSGTVSIEVGSQDKPGGAIRWKSAVGFVIGTDRKIDKKTTGALHCIRISDTSASTSWQLAGIDVEYSKAGAR